VTAEVRVYCSRTYYRVLCANELFFLTRHNQRPVGTCWDVSEMENSSLSSHVWNNTTTSSSEGGGMVSNVFYATNLALKVTFSIIGTVGFLDNLFVIVVFVFFIKIADKVVSSRIFHSTARASRSQRASQRLSFVHLPSDVARPKFKRRQIPLPVTFPFLPLFLRPPFFPPSLPPISLSLSFPLPLEVGPLNPARGSGGALCRCDGKVRFCKNQGYVILCGSIF